MASFKIVFFGKASSGKTQLSKQLTLQEAFDKNYKPTIGAEFHKRSIDKHHSLDLWDVSGEKDYGSLIPDFYKDAEIGILCVDLTKSIDTDIILEQVKQFREYVPNAPLIIVGTKSDVPNNLEAFNQLRINKLFQSSFITSAKKGIGLEELFSELAKICYGKKDSLWEEACVQLQTSLKNDGLSEEKRILIENELKILSTVILSNPDDPDVTPLKRVQAIDNFTRNCEEILEGDHPNVLKAILSVTAAAVVTAIAVLLGFGIGFACGIWSGPGAFISGIIVGTTAAIAVVSSSAALGAVGGGITAYGLFRTSKEVNVINEFTTQISALDREIVL